MAKGGTNVVAAPGGLGALLRLIARIRNRQARPHHLAVTGVSSASAVQAAPADVPPPLPLTLRQWLWGPGCVIPGNAEYVVTLVKPFGLTPAMTMLDVSAGLGGPIRAVAEAFNTYTVGLERDPELARLGMEMSVTQGVAKRAPVSVYDPESLDFQRSPYDCVLGREIVHGVRDKERFLRVLKQGLKAQGQLLLTEFVRDRAVNDNAVLAAWAATQPYKAELWTLERYADCLKSLGFDVRVTEDMTPAYRRLVAEGWRALTELPELVHAPRSHFRPVLDEAERTIALVKALRNGALKMCRIYALSRR